MGLGIGNYSRPYSVLQQLRRKALEVENNEHTLEEVYAGKPTRFNEFINHSDCEGGYISFHRFGINKLVSESAMCGNLDALKEEMADMKQAIEDGSFDLPNEFLPNPLKNAMLDFISDVEEAEMVLEFH